MVAVWLLPALVYTSAVCLCAHVLYMWSRLYVGHRDNYRYPALQKLCLRCVDVGGSPVPIGDLHEL